MIVLDLICHTVLYQHLYLIILFEKLQFSWDTEGLIPFSLKSIKSNFKLMELHKIKLACEKRINLDSLQYIQY